MLALAKCGNTLVQFDLGTHYSAGFGVTQDYACAYFWYAIGLGPD